MIPEDERRRLDRITAGSVDRALNGFPLKSNQSADRLAVAIQEALHISMFMSRDVSHRTSPDFNRRGPRGTPDRQSNAATKKAISALAKRSADLAQRLGGRSKETDDVLWMHAFWNKSGVEDEQPKDHVRFVRVVRDLNWAAGFLADAADNLGKQSPRWVDAEHRERRIFHAHLLSTAYEWAFGKPATVTKWHDRLEGHWPDFFQRIMGLVFDEPKTPNLEAVLDEARRRSKNSGALFDPEKRFE